MIHNLLTGITSVVIRCSLIAVALFCTTLSLQAQIDRTFKPGETASFTFPQTLCRYQWTNSNTNIGLPANGFDDIAPFTIINNGTQPIKATLMVSTIPVPARGYAYDPQGQLALLDLKTFKQEDLVPVPNSFLLKMSPDGTVVYVLDRVDKNTIYKVSTINNKVLGSVKLSSVMPPATDALLISPDGKRAYFLTYGQLKVVLVINTETMTEEPPIMLDQKNDYHYPALSPDGSRLYIPSDVENKVTIVNTATKKIENTLSVKRPFSILINQDGSKVTITSSAATNAFIYRPADGSITTIPIGEGSIQSRIAANGNVYMKSGLNNLGVHVINGTTGAYSFIKTNENDNLVLSPDGNTLYAVALYTGKVKVISTTTNLVTDSIMIDVTKNGKYSSTSYAQVSFDGGLIYITNRVDEMGKLRNYRLVADTKTKKVIDTLNTADLNIIGLASTSACSGNTITYNITVDADPPVINVAGQIDPLKTIYGTPSASTSFMVSGTKIIGGIKVAPPAGLEVSKDNIVFSDAVTIGANGDVVSTRVYVRIKAQANVALYTGDITVSSTRANDVKMPLSATEVTKAPLKITLATVEKIYGVTLTAIKNTKAFTSVGLKNDDVIDGADLIIGTGSLPDAAAKTYPSSVIVTALSGSKFRPGNYQIDTPPGNLEVTKAKLTITANNISRGYQVANLALTFNYSGFVNNEGVAQLSTLPVVSTTATINSQVGKYPITISGASAANYTMVYVPGILTIEAILLVVPNTFTPNGDGINDTWTIRYIEQYPQCTVMVTNRNGGQVFYSTGYTNPWNGQSKAGVIPAGTYYYVLDPRNGQKPISGSITVIR